MLSVSNKYIAVEGTAGSGKTTMLEQAKLLYESQRVNIIGKAFTGKAAEGHGVRSRNFVSNYS